MVSLGKTNTPEFGSPCYTEPDVAPAGGDAVGPDPHGRWLVRAAPRPRSRPAWCRSPRAPTAAGRSGSPPPAADSSASSPPAGGSVVTPCTATRWVWRTAGSIARTVRDAAAMLDVLAGRRVGDPSWAPPPSETFLSSCDRDPGRLRVARFIDTSHHRHSRRPRVRDRLGGRLPAAGVARPRGRRRRGADAARGGPDRSRPAGRCSPRSPSYRPRRSTCCGR